MTRTKRGKTGRESGDRDSATGSEHRSKRTETPERTPHIAVANPAASRHAFFAGIGQCSDEAPICFGCMERIRALEAELAALEKEAVEGSWRARAEKAEAELADMKTPNGIVQDGLTFRGFVKTRGETPTSAWLRAEKAEARVKELEARVNELVGRVWDEADERDLRGEDRG